MLARSRLTDPAAAIPRVLTKRTLACVARLPARQGKLSLSLKVATTRSFMERDAVLVCVDYYTKFWRRCDVRAEHHYLFADPLDDLEAQRLYLEPPEGAAWCLVSITRQTDTRRIGISGSLRPKPLTRAPLAGLSEVLLSRDKRQLTTHLEHAKARADRAAAIKLLNRLVFLDREGAHVRLLREVTALDEMMRRLGASPNVVPAENNAVYRYHSTFTPPCTQTMSLSKWLTCEVLNIRENIDATAVEIVSGPDFLLRLLAAACAGMHVTAAPRAGDGQDGIAWITNTEIMALADQV